MTIKSKKQLYNKRNKTSKALKTRKQKGGNPDKFDFEKITNISNLEPNYQLYLIEKMDMDEENDYKDSEEYIGIIESIDTTNNKINFIPFGHREYKMARSVNLRDEYTHWKRVEHGKPVKLSFEDIEVYSLKSYKK
jgi:hypothetical protein